MQICTFGAIWLCLRRKIAPSVTKHEHEHATRLPDTHLGPPESVELHNEATSACTPSVMDWMSGWHEVEGDVVVGHGLATFDVCNMEAAEAGVVRDAAEAVEGAGGDDAKEDYVMVSTCRQDVEGDSVVGSGIDTSGVCTVETHAVSNANVSTVRDYDIMDGWQCAEADGALADELQLSYAPQRSVRASSLPTPTQLAFSLSDVAGSGSSDALSREVALQAEAHTDPAGAAAYHDYIAEQRRASATGCARLVARHGVAPATPAAHSSSPSRFSLPHMPCSGSSDNAEPTVLHTPQLVSSALGHAACSKKEGTEGIDSRHTPTLLSVRLPSSGKGLGATDRRGSYDRGCSSKKRSHGQVAWEHLQTVLGDNGFACNDDGLYLRCQLPAAAPALLTVSHFCSPDSCQPVQGGLPLGTAVRTTFHSARASSCS